MRRIVLSALGVMALAAPFSVAYTHYAVRQAVEDERFEVELRDAFHAAMGTCETLECSAAVSKLYQASAR